MATTKMDTVIGHLRRVLLRQDGAGWTDGQLLASFIDDKDEAAFEALVRRHGPMVFGVCRRLLHNHHDAEDAFQATFLVLARKASSVRPRERVANWLHGVALRTALKAKAMTAKRREREKQVTEMPEPEAAQQDQWRDLQPLLDRELNGLPENYRLPILLCDLEGKTIKDAAQQLGWPQGTLAGRLARGRKLLAKRLVNRGVALSAGSLAAISQNAVSAAVPISLMSTTVKAATVIAAGQAAVAGVVPSEVAALMEGVLKTMFLAKLKAVSVVLLVVAALSGAAGYIYQTEAAEQQKDQRATEKADKEKQPAASKNEKPKSDLERLQGTWKVVSTVDDGKKEEEIGNWTIKDTTLRDIYQPKDDVEGKTFHRFRLNETTNPKRIDLVEGEADDLFDTAKFDKRLDDADERKEGIYSIDGDTLKICISRKKGERPTAFESKQGSDDILIVLKREGDEDKKAALQPEAPKPKTAKTDLDRLQGIWSAVWLEQVGKRSKSALVFMVDGKRACLQYTGGEMQGGLYLEPTAKPKTFDLAMSTRTIEGIYSLEGDTLRLCYGGGGDEPKRPDGLHAKEGDQQVLIMLKRWCGPEIFPYRRPDGTRAFPTLLDKENTELPPSPLIAPQSKDNKP